MSSKGGRNKRAKNARKLDTHDAPSLNLSIIDKRLNIIPVGRQLERTPPFKTDRVSHQLNKPDDSITTPGQVIKGEPRAQEINKDISCNGSSDVLEDRTVKDDRKSIKRSSSTSASATPGNSDPETFIQGMQGYQWTDTDLEFVYQVKLQKKVQQLQQKLSDVQKSLKTSRQMRDMAVAQHDKDQAELSKMLSCERVQEMMREILLESQSSVQLEGLDFKSLLARLKISDVQHATSEERTNIEKLNAEVTKAQTEREKQWELAKEVYICKTNVDQIKENINTLTADIVALESQLAKRSGKEEALGSAKPRQRVRKGPKPPAATSSPKVHTVPKPTTAQSTPTAPKPFITSKAPNTRSAPIVHTVPKPTTPQSAPSPSIAAKAPTARSAPKVRAVTKPTTPQSAPKAPTAPKPSIAAKASTARSAPKVHAVTKPTTPQSAPKASTAPKPSIAAKAPTARSAPKASTAAKASVATKTSVAPKPSTAPKVLEGDVSGLRRSKRIASKKQN